MDIKEKGSKNYPMAAYKPQFDWANNVPSSLGEEIFSFELFPIHILNEETIKQVIFEADDDEKVTFIKKMASSSNFDLVYVPFKEMNNFFIYTKFDNEDTKKYAFGKSDGVADLSALSCDL